MSDQQFHNIGVLQLGPGKDGSGLVHGRYLDTSDPHDKFAFRTPPLRNVALTGPWHHKGAYAILEEVVGHHLNAAASLTNYSGSHLSVKARETLHSEPTVIMEMMSTLDPPMKIQRELSAEEFYQLMAFLQALISSSAVDLSQLVPESMPSGLQIWD